MYLLILNPIHVNQRVCVTHPESDGQQSCPSSESEIACSGCFHMKCIHMVLFLRRSETSFRYESIHVHYTPSMEDDSTCSFIVHQGDTLIQQCCFTNAWTCMYEALMEMVTCNTDIVLFHAPFTEEVPSLFHHFLKKCMFFSSLFFKKTYKFHYIFHCFCKQNSQRWKTCVLFQCFDFFVGTTRV